MRARMTRVWEKNRSIAGNNPTCRSLISHPSAAIRFLWARLVRCQCHARRLGNALYGNIEPAKSPNEAARSKQLHERARAAMVLCALAKDDARLAKPPYMVSARPGSGNTHRQSAHHSTRPPMATEGSWTTPPNLARRVGQASVWNAAIRRRAQTAMIGGKSRGEDPAKKRVIFSVMVWMLPRIKERTAQFEGKVKASFGGWGTCLTQCFFAGLWPEMMRSPVLFGMATRVEGERETLLSTVWTTEQGMGPAVRGSTDIQTFFGRR